MSAFPLTSLSFEATPVERAPRVDLVRLVTLLTLFALCILNLVAISFAAVWFVSVLV